MNCLYPGQHHASLICFENVAGRLIFNQKTWGETCWKSEESLQVTTFLKNKNVEDGIMRAPPGQVGQSYPKNSCLPDICMWQSQ